MSAYDFVKLCQAEGWKVSMRGRDAFVHVNGKEIRVNHPFAIYSKLYREETNPELKYSFFKRMSEILWPKEEFHDWTADRYKTHCEPWKIITYAGGASCAKSRDAAKIAILFWLSDPKNNAVVIASTTLSSLTARIGGYALNLLKDIQIKFPYVYMRAQPPKILFERDDHQHGIFFVAAKQGDDDAAIKDIIGRHPRKRLMVVLDESTDMPLALVGALPNLEQGVEWFQIMAIGNSNSVYDLHGVLSTPKVGWNNIDPMVNTKWETTQKGGVALYFSPYNSPAINETDEAKKQRISKFLITKEQLDEKEKQYGLESDSFWRFVLGFWRARSTESVVVSNELLLKSRVFERPEWLGVEPLMTFAGLDVGFSTGGDKCILRLGVLGQDTSGKIVLDFKGDKLLYKIDITASSKDPAEIQIAKQVIEIMNRHGIGMRQLCIDASGQGRALGGTLMLQAGSTVAPLKVLHVRQGDKNQNSFEVIIKTPYDLWNEMRGFIENQQIRGLDNVSAIQLKSRMVIRNVKTGKVALEGKMDYKRRMNAIMPSLAHSPDEADAACLCLISAIQNYGFSLGMRKEIRKVESEHDRYHLWKTGVRQAREAVVAEERTMPTAGFTMVLEDWAKNRKSGL